jgi:hypothetical protein
MYSDPEPASSIPKQDVSAMESADESGSTDESRAFDHLVFVVHGIGGGLLDGKRVEHHRETFDTACHQALKDKYKDVPLKMHFELVEWRKSLGEYCEDSDRLVRACTVAGVKRMRDFANDIFLDGLYFLHNVYNRAIIEEVANQLNEKYDAFRKKHRDFTGKVSIFAHSLGAVIIFDIIETSQVPVDLYAHGSMRGVDDVTSLRNASSASRSPLHRPPDLDGNNSSRSVGLGKSRAPKLRFHVEHFFAAGNPLGVFLSIRKRLLGPNFVAPEGCSHFYNIFHPYDPVAYRVEPLVDEAFAELDPIRVVAADVEERLHKSLKDKFLDKFGWKKAPTSKEGDPTERLRFDYELQESFLENGFELLVGLRAHHCYWAHKDVALFVIKKLLASSDYFYLL